MPPRRASAPRYDPQWARTATGKFHRLPHLDPEAEQLASTSGVFVIWHAGVRPAWVYVDHSSNLAQALHAAAADETIMSYEANGGLYVTWARIPADHHEGVTAHLTATLRPRVPPRAALPDDAFPIPVLAPGQTAESD